MPSVYSNHLLADESQYQRIGRGAPKNLIINGDFSIWQRGVSQTTSGYGSDDRFSNEHVGSSKTVTRETWPLGDTDNINNNKYFSRTTVTSSAGAGNYVVKTHKIENVITTANKDITVSFRAKADAAKNIALEFVQNFGTGGSPSAAVTGIGVTTFALTTSWQTFTVTIRPPSIAGKILGTDNNDSFNLNFWYDAGTNLDARTNSLGQQSGTFDIDSFQVEFGTVATDFEYVPKDVQMQRCLGFFERKNAEQSASLLLGSGFNESATQSKGFIRYTRKRATPTVTPSSTIGDFKAAVTGSDLTALAVAFGTVTIESCEIALTVTGAVAGQGCSVYILSPSAYVDIIAEL